MADDIARMRAALSNSWDDNTPIPAMTQSVNPLDIIKAAYQNMPGAGVAQAGLAMGSDMAGNLLGNIYGVGKQIATGQLGTPQGTEYAFNQAQNLANAMHYTPPTQAGRDIYEGVNKLPQMVTGSHMGVGPLPELWNAPMHFSPDNLRVAGKTAIEDIRNFPSDYTNAQQGLMRDYPTLGSRAAGATDAFGQAIMPIAERINNQVMETGGIKVPGVPDLFNIPVASYAVKPKGGNWPTNLGSTLPLKEQGVLGEYLSASQYSDPVAVFEQQLKKHFPSNEDNRNLLRDWEDFLHYFYQNNANGIKYSDLDGPAMMALKKEAADQFAKNHNIAAAEIDPTNKKLHTASEIETALAPYNAWVMGPFQKYITNQMGTGLATDPLLQAVNEGGIPVHEIFGMRHEVPEYTQDSGEERRRSFVNNITDYGTNASAVNALKNSPVGKITATTPEGVSYENLLDMALYPKGTYAFSPKEGFPVSAKIDDRALITDFLNEPVEHTGFSNIRKQVFQDLLSGNISPDKLSNVTPATVTRQMIKDKMAEFKKAQLSKKGAADWIPKRAAAMPTDMAFSDGSKMTIITPKMANADENMTARDLGQITIDLNQCVGSGCHATQDYPGHGPWLVPHTGKPPRGKVEVDKYGYLRRLKNGDIEIASLKDPNGVSQATLELKLEKLGLRDKEKAIIDWFKNNNMLDQKTEFTDNTINFGLEEAVRNAFQLYPELKDLILSSKQKSVQQLKGANNGDVDATYIPQMVEWLNKNADNLKDVRELSHLKEVHDLDNHYDAIGKMSDQRGHWYSPTIEEFFKKADDERLLPRFFTTDQFAQLATDYGVDLSAEPPKKLSDWDKQTLREEVYSVLIKDPESLYLQDNLKDHVVENLDILFGDRKPEGQVPLDIHRKLADMLLDHNGKYREQLVSTLGQLADKGPNGWVDEFTEPQIANMLNIMAGWFERHPMEKLPSNADFEKAIQSHPYPFNEISIPESPWHPSENDLVNAVHEMEPENAGEFDQVTAIRQHAYETLSETIRRQAPQAFEQLRDNHIIRQAFADVVRADPTRYGISNYAPALQEIIIDRFAREGFAPEQ